MLQLTSAIRRVRSFLLHCFLYCTHALPVSVPGIRNTEYQSLSARNGVMTRSGHCKSTHLRLEKELMLWCVEEGRALEKKQQLEKKWSRGQRALVQVKVADDWLTWRLNVGCAGGEREQRTGGQKARQLRRRATVAWIWVVFTRCRQRNITIVLALLLQF